MYRNLSYKSLRLMISYFFLFFVCPVELFPSVPVLLAFCSFLLFPSSELDLSLSLPPFDFFDLFFRFDEDFCPPFPACCGDWLPVELEPNWLQRRESTTKSVRWRK